MSVVAEGVEDRAHLATAGRDRRDVAQGYWISRPLPAAEVAPWFGQWHRRLTSRGSSRFRARPPFADPRTAASAAL